MAGRLLVSLSSERPVKWSRTLCRLDLTNPTNCAVHLVKLLSTFFFLLQKKNAAFFHCLNHSRFIFTVLAQHIKYNVPVAEAILCTRTDVHKNAIYQRCQRWRAETSSSEHAPESTGSIDLEQTGGQASQRKDSRRDRPVERMGEDPTNPPSSASLAPAPKANNEDDGYPAFDDVRTCDRAARERR